jgi:hypothetical protein
MEIQQATLDDDEGKILQAGKAAKCSQRTKEPFPRYHEGRSLSREPPEIKRRTTTTL